MELRAHHLLCLPMYQGHGYSEGFCAHMTKMIDCIRTTDEPIRILASPDEICAGCPHLCMDTELAVPRDMAYNNDGAETAMSETNQNKKIGAMLDSDGCNESDAGLGDVLRQNPVFRKYCNQEARISVKDRALLTALHLNCGVTYDRISLKEIVGTHMAEETFQTSCGKCQWLQEGLCSFLLWKKNFEETF